MIIHFSCKKTEAFWTSNGVKSKQFNSFAPVAMRKLYMLHAAQTIEDLRVPPSNHLEALKGKLVGYFSIRINIQYRIVFKFENAQATHVQITDYH